MKGMGFVIHEFNYTLFNVIKNWVASWKIMYKHPYLFLPDIAFTLLSSVLFYLLFQYLGITDIINGADQITKEVYLSFFKSNWFKLFYSITTFVILTFTFGISVFAYKYFMIADILKGTDKRSFFRRILNADLCIFSLVMLKVYTYFIFLASISLILMLISGVYKFFPSLNISFANRSLICFILLFLLFTLFSTAALFIKKLKASKALFTSYKFVKNNFMYSSLTLIFLILTFVAIYLVSYLVTLQFNFSSWFSGIYALIPVLLFKVFMPVFTFRSFKG